MLILLEKFNELKSQLRKMAVAINPPKEEVEEEKVIARFTQVVERLSKKAREEFARRLSKELKDTITPVAIAKAKKGKIHLSDKTIIDVALFWRVNCDGHFSQLTFES